MAGGERTRLYRGQVFAAEHVPIVSNRHLLHGDHEPHDHDFFEVAVTLRGKGVHRTIHGDQPIRPGEAFVLRPDVWHAYRSCSGLEVYNCCFGAELLRRELSWAHEEPPLNRLLGDEAPPRGSRGVHRLHISVPESLEKCRRHLVAIGENGSETNLGTRMNAIGHLLLFLAELARSTGLSSRAERDGSGVGSHPLVADGVRMLEDDPARRWSLAELAGRLAVDRSYLVRLFKSGTGLPPISYLNRHRAELAANLLMSTGLPVARVGEKVGWPDPNHFARRFRAYFGVSATAYRAKMGGPTDSEGGDVQEVRPETPSRRAPSGRSE